MVWPLLTSVSSSTPTLLLGASGQLICSSWKYPDPNGSSEGTEPFRLLPRNCGTSSPSTLDRPPHCPILKLVLRPIFIPWLSTQHETLPLFYCLMVLIIVFVLCIFLSHFRLFYCFSIASITYFNTYCSVYFSYVALYTALCTALCSSCGCFKALYK